VKKPGTYIVVGKARQLTVSIKVYIKDARLEKVKISKAKAKKKSIKLSWKKIKNVKTYEVAYRKKGTKKWSYKKVSRTSLTIKKIKSRKTYEVKVRTVVGKQKGTFSSIKKVKVK
jgi:fructan beta-fructosidase